MIHTEFCDLSDVDSACTNVLANPDLAQSFFNGITPSEHLVRLLDALRSDLRAVVEYPYVDKVYRDSYYSYFASKSIPYPKNAIRVSLFEKDMQKEHFYSAEGKRWLQENFLGFFVLRPTPTTSIVGRSCIAPRALINGGIRACLTSLDVSVFNVKMKALGFPHSSQDGETITCAETSLWALVEYFSTRYPEYHPVLPSQIHSILAGMSVERQVPSRGLEISRLSFALKALGFAPRIYGIDEFEENVFMDLVDIYVESGIPILTSMSNSRRGGKVAHAFLTVGKVNGDVIGRATELGSRGHYSVFDFPNARNLVVIDDNHPPYTVLDVEDNAKHFESIDDEWRGCQIDAIIVPLYPKIYLEAFEAREYVVGLIKESLLFEGLANHLSVRLYLASSRSYKNYMMMEGDEGPSDDIREAILSVEMPKFIWVAELYICDQHGYPDESEEMAQGLLIIDATEPNIQYDLGLIIGTWSSLLLFREGSRLEEVKEVTSRPFRGFNNLRTP